MQAAIYSIPPFDASIGTTIRFSWNGNQAFKNRCLIRDNETNATVYDNTITTFQFEHPIDITKAVLENGKKYHVYLTVFDKNDVESDPQSTGTLFYCLKTPVFRFKNITDGQMLQASSYAAALSYSQENGELLNSWSITLYTRSHSPLTTSGIKYSEDMHHTFYGFENNQEYAIRGQGETVNGIVLDTGFLNITVSYTVKEVFSLLVPENIKELGAVRLWSNIVTSEGRGDSPLVYLENQRVDLRNNTIHFTDGFEVSGNFSYVELFCGVNPNDTLLTLSGQDLTLTVTYRIVKADTAHYEAVFELKAACHNVHSVLYSNHIPVPALDDILGLCVYRENGFYHISVLPLEKGGET